MPEPMMLTKLTDWLLADLKLLQGFSTMGYQFGTAFLAAGAVGHRHTGADVGVGDVFAALPLYACGQ